MDQQLLSTLMGFHVRRDERRRYDFDRAWFASSGKAAVNNFYKARLFSDQINRKRDLLNHPELSVQAGQVNGIALIQGITHYIFRMYMAQRAPNLLRSAETRLIQQLGSSVYEAVLDHYIEQFPPAAVRDGQMDRAAYLAGSTDGVPNRDLALEELLLLWLANANPAFKPLGELFSDEKLKLDSSYTRFMSELYRFFNSKVARDPVGESIFSADENIIDVLLAPVRVSPDSLEGQLQFLNQSWGAVLGDYLIELLRGIDLIREETKPTFGGGFGGGGGFVEVATAADYAAMEQETENFTADRDWMPNLVLIAKNSYVWLDQLSRKYGRSITRLDEIPDEELRQFAQWGITGLWLIGLWERSSASQRIKQLLGNPDAVASAYSLKDYRIAEALGGEAACEDLKRRAWRYGIRLASDMVPNHVGIDGEWVMQHPDYFLSLSEPPYPSYSFNGPDLSPDPRIGIFIEDHYYNQTDAAVVFKRVDRWTGDTRYIYHGNDGTTMPWNDTAQLDYLNANLREVMIRLILNIAKQFPIIRFDAAMTLVKRHVARLWFPEPGSGGAIPSRSEHGMSKAEFDALMPQEFWREVVDRAAVEAPDTLLLAEAFWMMEGYFVRTLGMHRVYNSAFMNLLRDEDNRQYRWVMKNTLEFDPEVLRRYVNFMNNPDERTAVDQFGRDNKYFGIATLMMTMPGLPMLGHGQIEGFAERYGMEYRRAYYDEQVNEGLVQRHEREIFPLAHQRALFAGVDNFLLYDVFSPDGSVNEDIFAYSNRKDDARALVVYLNKDMLASGWIRTSVVYSVRVNGAGDRDLTQKNLFEGLGLASGGDRYVVFRDQRGGLEYIRKSDDLRDQGMYVELGPYQCYVFLDFREVAASAARPYDRVHAMLNGRGIASINEALQDVVNAPVRDPFAALVNADMTHLLLDARVADPAQAVDQPILDEYEAKMIELLRAIQLFTGAALTSAPPVVTADTTKTESAETPETDAVKRIAAEARQHVATALRLSIPPTADADAAAQPVIAADLPADDLARWGGLFAWLTVRDLGEVSDAVNPSRQTRSWIDEWRLSKLIGDALHQLGADDAAADQTVAAVKIWTTHQELIEREELLEPEALLNLLLRDVEVQQYLRVNRYDNVLWFNKEAFEHLLSWYSLLTRVVLTDAAAIAARLAVVDALSDAMNKSEYQVDKLRAALRQSATPEPTSEPTSGSD
jgi:glycosidase